VLQTFNMDAMTSFEGDTGPYLQYAHARLNSIMRKSGLTPADLDDADMSLLTEPHAVNIVRLLAQWPDVVQNTFKTLEPTTVLVYLFRLTHVVSSSYDVLQVIGSEKETMRARMALYGASRQVLFNGMTLLGLNPVERCVACPLLFFDPPPPSFLAHANFKPIAFLVHRRVHIMLCDKVNDGARVMTLTLVPYQDVNGETKKK
jgi:hypothetical protein